MKFVGALAVCGLTLSAFSAVHAAEISGEYLEARTCDVYTGPCFANGEIGIAGKEAVLAWKVDEGKWAGQNLAGLGVAVVITANDTLGFGGSFTTNPDKIQTLVIVDAKANKAQRDALVRFAKDSAPQVTKDIVKVESAPFTLTNDHLTGKGSFSAGKLAKIETRALAKGDCVCANESVFYPPLSKVDNSHPAFTVDMTFNGKGLNNTWTTLNKRSAFLATFSK